MELYVLDWYSLSNLFSKSCCVLLGISCGFSVAFTPQYFLASYVHKAREVLDLRPKTAFAHVDVKKAGRWYSFYVWGS